ncbi:MAG: MFS transporter [Dehalococcoidia bacterium]
MIGRWSSRMVRAFSRRQPPAPPPAAPPGTAPTRFSATFRALRNRNYRLFYFGQMVSLSGTWMQTIAQAWLVLQITDSKVALGTVTMLQFLPITIFVLFAGVIADRVPKRNFIIATQLLAMAQAVTLAALAWSGRVELWHVYTLAVVLGLANAFEQPTRQAFVIELVGRDDLMNAVALNSGMFNAARLIGPAIGGVVIATVGVKVAFLFNGVSFLPVIAGLLLMDTSRLYATPRTGAPRDNPVRELRDGLAYAFRTPATLLIVILMAFIGMFGINFTVMLPLVARYVLDGDAVALGFMTAAVGLGALIAALSLASRTTATRRLLFAGGAAFGVLLLGVAVSHQLPVTLLLLVLLGVAHTSFASTANTSMQLAAPDHLRGRVMSLYMLLLAGSTPAGGYFTGFVAEHAGVSTAVALNAGLCLAGVALGLVYYVRQRARIDVGPVTGQLSQAASHQ